MDQANVQDESGTIAVQALPGEREPEMNGNRALERHDGTQELVRMLSALEERLERKMQEALERRRGPMSSDYIASECSNGALNQNQDGTELGLGSNNGGSSTDTLSTESMQRGPAVELDAPVRIRTEELGVMRPPRAPLPTFAGGEGGNYWKFQRDIQDYFKTMKLTYAEKHLLLKQACTGEARDVLELGREEEPRKAYDEALCLLSRRYGDEERFADEMVDKLLSGPGVHDGNSSTIQAFSDEIALCLKRLEAMGKDGELNSSFARRRLFARLTGRLRENYLNFEGKVFRREGRALEIKDFIDFINDAARQARRYEEVATIAPGHSRAERKDTTLKRKVVGLSTVSTDKLRREVREPAKNRTLGCVVCQRRDHRLRNCPVFQHHMNPQRRLAVVRMEGFCIKCLRGRHRDAQCWGAEKCDLNGCGKSHHKLMHWSLVDRQGKGSDPHQEGWKDEKPDIQRLNRYREREDEPYEGSSQDVRLEEIYPNKRQRREEDSVATQRANRSDRSFCGRRLAERINATGKKTEVIIETLSGTSKEQLTTEVELVVWSTSNNGYEERVSLSRVLVIDQLPYNLTSCEASLTDVKEWEHLKDLKLSEANGEVEMIIGQNAPSALCPLETRKGDDERPYAVRTRLGWTVCGPKGRDELGTMAGITLTTICMKQDDHLNMLVRKFWEIDSAPHEDALAARMSVEDRIVLDLWERKGQLVGDHYELNIPFREDHPHLPDNKSLAIQRLIGLRRRLSRDKGLRHAYIEEIEKLIDKGYAERVPLSELRVHTDKIWYLPHHPVLNPNKPGKVRVVFDCAATFDNTSLNQQVMQGPDLTNKLIGVLLRFRQEPVALMADVEAMFHQIKVPREDRDVLRFLWWSGGDLDQKPHTFRMKVHLFGGIWSPSCAQYALQRTFRDHGWAYSNVVLRAERNFYVDDLLFSVSTPEEACYISEDLRTLLNTGGFHLTKWISNHRKVMQSIPFQERHGSVAEVDLGLATLPSERALGISWDLEHDKLTINSIVPNKPWTKRGILSIVSSVFDPLGFLCPYTIKARIIFQEECKRKSDWDEPIAEEIFGSWRRWLEELPRSREICVPRCYVKSGLKQAKSVQLHIFCDASTAAYAAVSYLRVENKGGDVSCSFVFGRARLAPIKLQTIPRLELCAAVMAAKMSALLKEELDLKIDKVTCWTDSEIVLRYITNTERRFHVFVANRVANIRELTATEQWKFIGTKLNPADEATRGESLGEMINTRKWIQGPTFLLQEEASWPTQIKLGPISEGDPEVKKTSTVTALCTQGRIPPLEALWNRYSSWYHLLKGVAWIRRYLKWLRHNQDQSYTERKLTVMELRAAKYAIILAVQNVSFEEELKHLKRSNMPKQSSIYRLEPYLDDYGLIRVGGRIKRTWNKGEGQILLPRDHPTTELIIREIHQIRVGHGGREQIMATLREEFWVPKCRRLIDRILKQCVICRRNNWRMKPQRQADLPVDRTNPQYRPFASTGLDCFGPFMVKLGRKRLKRWGCLFSCMATRAIHLEVLPSLEADTLIMAISRFISRRGRPDRMRSDNGTNMIGADKELRQAMRSWASDERLHDSLVRKEIEWLFNPPSASHMGGVWERQIRTVRKVLRAIVGSQVLDDYSLQSVFCEIEDIVNRRPITPMSSDVNDLEALTPSHLLLCWGGQNQLPLGGILNKTEYRKCWKQAQLLADNFWKRWRKQYLPQLLQRKGIMQTSRNLQKGDMVIVTDDSAHRNQWKLGRLIETVQGDDGIVRQVTVKTARGILVRPSTKICLLELSE